MEHSVLVDPVIGTDFRKTFRDSDILIQTFTQFKTKLKTINSKCFKIFVLGGSGIKTLV